MTDAELYKAICADGRERELAIIQLRELLVRGLSKSLTSRYGKPISIEDVVQEALIKILDALHQFQGRSEFKTWAMSIAIRVGISELRRRYHADQSIEAFTADESGRFELLVSEPASSVSSHARQELLKVLQDLIDHRLTEKQRVVIRAFLSAYSTDGMANALHMNRNAVYKLLHDARMRLKEGLAVAGYSAEEVLSLLSAEEARL